MRLLSLAFQLPLYLVDPRPHLVELAPYPLLVQALALDLVSFAVPGA